jgi:hypothetical protein
VKVEFAIKPKIIGMGIVGKTYICAHPGCGASVFLPRPTGGVAAYPESARCEAHKEN